MKIEKIQQIIKSNKNWLPVVWSGSLSGALAAAMTTQTMNFAAPIANASKIKINKIILSVEILNNALYINANSIANFNALMTFFNINTVEGFVADGSKYANITPSGATNDIHLILGENIYENFIVDLANISGFDFGITWRIGLNAAPVGATYVVKTSVFGEYCL